MLPYTPFDLTKEIFFCKILVFLNIKVFLLEINNDKKLEYGFNNKEN